jgi:hemin uptake protein HemP
VNAPSDDSSEDCKTAADGAISAGAKRIWLSENRVDSRDLFAGTREITIVHGGDAYRLRLTAQNKLILTK